jgi:CheY-like chemotaxis protein
MEENKPYNVLIVDDDAFLLDMYSLKFKENGHEVYSALTAKEALEKIRAGEKYDVILLDLVMPEMDGFEFLSVMRQERLLMDSSVIILTNQNRPTDIDRARKLGIDGYIVKASSVPSEVAREVDEIINKKKMA